jgi:hypothetical protein
LTNIPIRYRTYLIRIWAEGPEAVNCRFSVENIHDHSRWGFSTLEELFAFLEHSVVELAKVNDIAKGDAHDAWQ